MSSGQTLIITAAGTVSETITEGAYVLLQVKYGLIRLISTTADLCEQIGEVDLECPIEKGLIAITKAVELPNEIPPVRRTLLPARHHCPLQKTNRSTLAGKVHGSG